MLDLTAHDRDLEDPLYHANIRYLTSLPKFGDGLSLHRISKLIDSDQLRGLKAIKITGTNGKGSVAAMLNAIFCELGLRPGLFTSPHLLRFNERIKINNQDIDNISLAASISWIKGAIAAYQKDFSDQFGAFEMFTGLALHHFATNGVEHMIFEAGIGGRFDAIRPIDSDLAALTSLDLEHTQLLGNSLEEIAYNKIDICSDGTSLVLGDIGDPQLLSQIQAYARLKRLNVLEASQKCLVTKIQTDPKFTHLDIQSGPWRWHDLKLSLKGKHQIDNLKVALVLTLEYLRLQQIHIDANQAQRAIARALETLYWPGRSAGIHHEPPVFIDVGHTPKAIGAFIASWPQLVGHKPILLVTGVSKNKAIDEIIAALVTEADEVICTKAHHMGAAVARIEAAIKVADPVKPCITADTVEKAVQLALDIATKKQMAVVVAGGLFLAIEFQMALAGCDPKSLWFF